VRRPEALGIVRVVGVRHDLRDGRAHARLVPPLVGERLEYVGLVEH